MEGGPHRRVHESAPSGTAGTDHIRLADGRRLAYAAFGPSDGSVIMHFHGVPSSRLEAFNEAHVCEGAGVRLVAPDRPGCGLSDPLPGRTLLDWPRDVAALADALGVDRFAVMGVSGGGPYALACAREIPARLTGVVLVSSCGRLDGPGALEGVGPLHALLFRLAGSRPRAARALMAVLRPVVDRAPRLVQRGPWSGLCPADAEFLAGAHPEIARTRNLVESARQGLDGPLRDFALLAAPWGFEPEDVTMRVDLWHGDVDRVIPLRHSLELAARLPQARLVVCPDEGHFLLAARMPEILRSQELA